MMPPELSDSYRLSGIPSIAVLTMNALYKDRHPGITLTLLLPYHPAERPVKTPPYFDGTFYPLGMEAVPRRLAIVRANRYMVDNSNFLIAYAWHPASNARELVEYAQRREKAGLIHIALLKHDKGVI